MFKTPANKTGTPTLPSKISLSQSRASLFWLFIATALPSLVTPMRYGKLPGLVLYLLFTAFWVWFLLPRLMQRMNSLAGIDKIVPRLVAAVMVLFTIMFLVVYPLSHSGKFGNGNDRADALNISIPRLLTGKNPYTARTYFGNPITPLPGAMLLGSPFRVILRDAAYQNIVWTLGLFLLLNALTATASEAFLLWLTLLLLNLEVFHDMMTGGDYGDNSIYVAAATYVFLHALSQPKTSGRSAFWKPPLLAAVWGLCLCSRLSYLAVIPFAFMYAVQVRGVFTAVALTTTALAVYALLVLPFYLADPRHFAPLEIVSWKVTGSTHSSTLLIAAAAIAFLALSLLISWAGRRYGLGYTFASSAVCLTLPLPLLMLTTYHRTGRLDFADLTFASSSSIFVVAALSLLANRTSAAPTSAAPTVVGPAQRPVRE